MENFLEFLDPAGLALYDSLIKAFINSKIFIGTSAEYQVACANNQIPINTLVIITDDETSAGSTSSKLGEGVLGHMILG